MALQQIEAPRAENQIRGRQVLVLLGAHDGWDVVATLDGCILESRHCQDWHRVERTRRRMESERQPQARRTATAR